MYWALIESCLMVRLLKIKTWRRALQQSRLPLDCMKRREVSQGGRHTGRTTTYGIRKEFGGVGALGYAFDIGGLDAPEYLNAGSMEADTDTHASSSCASRGWL